METAMTTHQKIASTIVALGMMAVILYLVRKRHLREEFSLIWLFCALAMVGVVWFYPALVFVTHLIGAVLPTTTMFIFAFIFVLLLCLHFSISLSRLRTQMKDLTQKLALMEARWEEEKAGKGTDLEENK
ncbi:MAG: DUF2304 domain-containing protein [Desulfobaccales bacterium]|nr:DUF2304 domain-containing protein [Desulfobaccales bacterium]